MSTEMTQKRQGVTWDLTGYFKEFNGPEMLEFKDRIREDITAMQEKAAKLDVLNAGTADDWEALLLKAEDTATRLGHVFSYVGCLSAADAVNEDFHKEEAVLMQLGAEFGKFAVDVQRAFKGCTDEFFAEFLKRDSLKGAEYSITRDRIDAMHTMSREQEMLTTDLNTTGFHTWGRLYDTVSSKLEFEMEYPDGRKETKPISQWRSLMSDADREVGKAAFEGGNRAWAKVEDVCAAALNAIAGTRHTLYKYRGIDHFLDKALFQSRIERKTLDAMYQAIYDNIETAREIFRIKAGSMGRTGIHWFEREAPLAVEDSKLFSWDDGVTMVSQAFNKAYPELGAYYKDFLEKRWLESEPRPGKRPGAFCTSSEYSREQRVYMTFNGAIGDVTTMAHEVGHAWHGHILKDMRPMAQEYPMTLAETASIFAEHILAEGIYADDSIGDEQKLAMLDADLCGAATLLLDIAVRFEFEKTFYEERQQGEVSVSRFKEIMVEKQKQVMGNALIEGSEDPLFWASKLHFYITGVSFYNFPYTFGFLLARTLFNLFKQEGAAFLPKYEEFLRLTGSDSVENVAMRSLGKDISDPAFWNDAITSLEGPLNLYKDLLTKKFGC